MNSYVLKSQIVLLKACEENGKLMNLYLQHREGDIVFLQDYVLHSDLLYESYKQINEYFMGKKKKYGKC